MIRHLGFLALCACSSEMSFAPDGTGGVEAMQGAAVRVRAPRVVAVGEAIGVDVRAGVLGQVRLYVSPALGETFDGDLRLALKNAQRVDTVPADRFDGDAVLRVDPAATSARGTRWIQVAIRGPAGWVTSTARRVLVDEDLDLDGLLSRAEDAAGTDPRRWDSDGDGSPDGWELENGFDPLVADSGGAADADGDGRGAALEAWLGTDPSQADPTDLDSDGDGVSDLIELYGGRAMLSGLGSNPAVADARLCVPYYGLAVAWRNDRDADCMPDDGERATGADPHNPDSDADGIPDGVEWADLFRASEWCQNGPISCALEGFPPHLDPVDPDVDGDGCLDGEDPDPFASVNDADGLSDCDELAAGTDPWTADTDGDGVLDGAEVRAGLNPLLPDTDTDGLTDGQEARVGSSPLLVDTDGDGLSDGDEARVRFTLPTRADSDAGGRDDAAEVALGTDPADPTDDGFGVAGPALQLRPRLVITSMVLNRWDLSWDWIDLFSRVTVRNDGLLPELRPVSLVVDRWNVQTGQEAQRGFPVRFDGATAELRHAYSWVTDDYGVGDWTFTGDVQLFEEPWTVGALRLEVDGEVVDSWGDWGVRPVNSPWGFADPDAGGGTIRIEPAIPRGDAPVLADWSSY